MFLDKIYANDTRKVILVGDIEDSQVQYAIKNSDPDFVIVLGDLGYRKNLSWFKQEYVNEFGKKLKCVLGDHDTIEYGDLSLENEAIELCGNSWWLKIDNSLFLGFNTEGDLHNQLNDVNYLLNDKKLMKNVDNLYVLTHKNCLVETRVKAYKFCNILVSMIPPNMKIYFVSGHNHIMSYNVDSRGYEAFISGAGGSDHHTCSGTVWIWCSDKTYGFLEFLIEKSTVESTFYDTNGNILYKVDKK